MVPWLFDWRGHAVVPRIRQATEEKSEYPLWDNPRRKKRGWSPDPEATECEA